MKGFSIVEVLISSFVLAIGLVAIMALIASGLKNSFETRDTIIATGLAQEGIELVRNVRDNNLAAGGDGFAAFPNQKHCRIGYNDVFVYPDATTVTPDLDCTGSLGSLSRYTLQYSSNLYQHSNTLAERFSRYIYIDFTNGPSPDALVRSFVYWGGIFTPPNSGGSSTACTALNKCVFTEIKLTAWK